jgi:hypothetical protein
LATSPLRITTSNFIFHPNTCGYIPHVTSSLTRGWVCSLKLLLALASAVILRSKSRDTHGHILLSQIQQSPNLDGQVLVFISPQEQDGPVIPPVTGSPFRRLLRLAGSRWRFSTPLPHGQELSAILGSSLYCVGADSKKTLFPREYVCVAQQRVVYHESAALATALSRCFDSTGTCLPSRCPAMDVPSDFTTSTFGSHVTI